MIDDRKTKAEAGHQATPKKRMKCEICANFEFPDGCKKVKGAMSTLGWCNLYQSQRKASEA